MKGNTIQAIDTLGGLFELRDEWTSLLSDSNVDTLFLTWEWMTAWAEHYITGGNKLLVLVLREKNSITGIAPWYVNTVRYGPFRLRRIEFLGTHGVGSDFLDIISSSGKEKETACRLYNFLMGNTSNEWDCLLFRGIPADSMFCNNFIQQFQKDGKYIRVTCGSYCPIVKLPEKNEQFLSSMRPHRRRQYNRHLRAIQHDNDVRYEINKDFHENRHLTEFLSFYKETWGNTSERYPQFLDTFRRRAEGKNWMELECLRKGEKYVAAILHILYNGTKYSYLTATDKNFNRRVSFGNVLICLAIQDAVRQNMENYNFLKGGEPYKFRWANSGKQLLDIFFQKRKSVSAMQFAAETLRNAGKIILR